MPVSYEQLFLIPKDEYFQLNSTSREHAQLVDCIQGDVNGGQVNHIEIGEGGKVVIKPTDIVASSSSNSPSSSSSSRRIKSRWGKERDSLSQDQWHFQNWPKPEEKRESRKDEDEEAYYEDEGENKKEEKEVISRGVNTDRNSTSSLGVSTSPVKTNSHGNQTSIFQKSKGVSTVRPKLFSKGIQSLPPPPPPRPPPTSSSSSQTNKKDSPSSSSLDVVSNGSQTDFSPNSLMLPQPNIPSTSQENNFSPTLKSNTQQFDVDEQFSSSTAKRRRNDILKGIRLQMRQLDNSDGEDSHEEEEDEEEEEEKKRQMSVHYDKQPVNSTLIADNFDKKSDGSEEKEEEKRNHSFSPPGDGSNPSSDSSYPPRSLLDESVSHPLSPSGSTFEESRQEEKEIQPLTRTQKKKFEDLIDRRLRALNRRKQKKKNGQRLEQAFKGRSRSSWVRGSPSKGKKTSKKGKKGRLGVEQSSVSTDVSSADEEEDIIQEGIPKTSSSSSQEEKSSSLPSPKIKVQYVDDDSVSLISDLKKPRKRKRVSDEEERKSGKEEEKWRIRKKEHSNTQPSKKKRVLHQLVADRLSTLRGEKKRGKRQKRGVKRNREHEEEEEDETQNSKKRRIIT